VKKAAIYLMFLAVFGLIGCTSVPQVKSGYPEGEGKYRVEIDSDYLESPEEFRYAVNSFVIQQGGKSYDVEKVGFWNDFIITIPGNTLVVEDMPEVRHFHRGRTTGLILGTTLPIALLIFVIALTPSYSDYNPYNY
jgi:hypothetical protein